MSKNQAGDFIVRALTLLTLSPILLVVILIFGIFNLGAMVSLFSNLYVLGLVILLNVLFFATDRLGIPSALFTGALVGFIFWAIGIVAFCNSPVGQLACGTITAISIFTSLIGYVIGGVVISGFVGGFLMLIKR